jgi:hypothetical protein
VVLARAVLIVDADVGALTEEAHAIEAQLGQLRRHRAAAATGIARAWSQLHRARPPGDFAATLGGIVAAQFA